jgi:tetratricopeptide (TPR) repeat protein
VVVPDPHTERRQVFISYAHADALDFAERLAADLEARGRYRTFFDRQSIDRDGLRGAGLWEVLIEDGIRQSWVMAAVLTRGSVAEESVCRDEVAFALNAHKRVVPLRKHPEAKPTLLLARRHWIDFTQDYERALADLLRYLAGDESASLPPALPTVTGLLPLDFGPDIARHYAGFMDRAWVTRELAQWLEVGRDRLLLLVGEPGVGKSAIAAWLCMTRAEVIGVHFCGGQDRARHAYELVASLVAQLHARLPGYAELVERRYPDVRRETAADAFRDLVVEPTRELPAQTGPRLIVVDALDESLRAASSAGSGALPQGDSGGMIGALLARHVEDLPEWLRVLVTTRPEASLLAQLQRFATLDMSAGRPESLRDVSRYVALRCSQEPLAARLRDQAPRVTTRIEELAEGNLLYARLVLDALETGQIAVGDLGQLTRQLKTYYYRACQQRFPDADEYHREYLPLLRALTAAREPLPFALLTGHAEAETANRRLARLHPYLRVGHEGETTTYWLFHGSFRDWLTDRDGGRNSYWVDVREGHALLADRCWQEFAQDPRDMSGYAKAHLASHLREAGRWTELVRAVASSRLNLMAYWTEHGATDDGLECLTELVRESEQGRIPGAGTIYAAALATQLARIYGLRGDYERALEWLLFASERTSWHRGRRVHAVALHELGSLWLSGGQTGKAGRAYREALRLCLWGWPVYRDEVAANRLALATVAFRQYRWSRLISLARRAMKEARAAGDYRHEIAAQRLIGVALDDLGRYAEARGWLERALQASRERGAVLEEARVLSALGCLHYGQALLEGRPPVEAEGHFREASEVARNIHALHCLLDAQLRAGWCALAVGRGEEAVDLFQHVADMVPAGSHAGLRAGTSAGLGATSHLAGETQEAERHYSDALAVARQMDLRGWATVALVGQGALAWHAGQTERATEAWARARQYATDNSPRTVQLAELNISSCKTSPRMPPR